MSVKELQSNLTEIKGLPGSEGVMIKGSHDIYPTTGHISSWVKYKSSADVHVVVIKRNETKTAGTFNYYIGILASESDPHTEQMKLKNDKLAYIMNVGKTNNIAKKFDPGDIITVLPHTIFKYEDDHYIFYECPIYESRPDQSIPDSVAVVEDIARKQHILKAKFEKSVRYVLQLHFVGKSVHGDLRMEKTPGGTLEGRTIALNKGNLPEDIDTVSKARHIAANWSQYLKPINDPNTHLLVPEVKGESDNSWLHVNNRVDKPGEGIISSKNEYGVMIVVDAGTFERGSQKSYYQEYFFHGKILKGRFVVRLLHLGGEDVWQMWKTKDEEPYVISSRAVSEGWFPKEGSGLPAEVENKVPKDLKFWESTGEARIEQRKALRKHFLHEFASERWLLQYQWYRGQIVKRKGPTTEFYYLRLIKQQGVETIEMIGDPRTRTTSGLITTDKYDEFWDIKDEVIMVPPGTTYNQTKDTPSYLMTLDSGKLTIIKEESLIREYKLSESLTLTMTRSSEESEFWEVHISQ